MRTTTRTRGLLGLLGLSCLAATLYAAPLAAQTTADEVVVVATRRPARMQDVPVAVTVISADRIERAGIDNLRDIERVTPNFGVASTQTETTSSKFRVRGISTAGNNIGFESSVGMFLDGVSLSRPGVALTDLFDIEHVEIMRGPQGTLFGRNTSAGAVYIVTRSPDLAERQAWLDLGVGNFGASSIGGGTNLPLVPSRLGVRFSGAIRNRDGYVRSVSGAESQTRDRFSVRAQALWAINQDLSLRVITDHTDVDERCCDAVIATDSPLVEMGAFVAAGLPSHGGAIATGPASRSSRTSNSEGFRSAFDQTGLTAQLEWKIDDTTSLTYLGSYRRYDSDTVQNADFVDLAVFSGPGTASDTGLFDEITSYTHELRMNGSKGRLDWLIGISVVGEELEQGLSLELGSDFAAYIDAIAWHGLVIPVTSGTPLEAVPLATGGTFGDVLASSDPTVAFAGGLDPTGAYAGNRYRQSSKPKSIFTHNIVALSERLDLAAGLRYVEEDKSGSFSQDGAGNPACLNSLANAGSLAPFSEIGLVAASFACFPFAAPANVPGTPLPVTFSENFSDSELIYATSLLYRLRSSTNIYASFTHGFKSGGFNLDATAAILGADPRFRSEEVDSWELGVKTSALNGRLRASAALFDMEIRDYQVLEFTGVQFLTFNVPHVESSGLEIELSASPTERLQLGLAATHMKARYPSNCAGNSPSPPREVSSLCGSVLNNAPDWSGSLSADFDARLTDALNYSLRAALQFESQQRTSIQPVDPTSLNALPDDIQGGYAKLDLAFGISPGSGNWTVELWGHNVLDRRTHRTSINIPLRGISALGTAARGVFVDPPRTVGMSLRVRL